MHYYQFNIGDYSSHTQHLDPIEDIAYRRMLDWYYTHEQPLPLDVQEIARQIRMRDHAAAIRDVLNEFFQQTDEGWFSSRVEKEIEHYQTKKQQASRAGKASAERRFNGRSTDVQPTNNHKPITNNQEPVTTKEPRKRVIVEKPDSVSQQVWDDWLTIRKSKKAALTQTAWVLMLKEVEKAGWTIEAAIDECCLRTWASFKASWVNKPSDLGGGTMNKQEALEARNKAIGDAWLREQGAIV
jgi:uncharacterized protein YdaU (DUF1376 family)